MPQPEYTPEAEVHGVDEPEEQRPPRITVPRIRVRSALRRSPRARQDLAIAIALAEEEVMRAHVRNVTRLLTRTVRDAPLEEALTVYMRILNLPRPERQLITARAMTLLQEQLSEHLLRRAMATPYEEGGILDRFTRRLRGRQQDRLRVQVAIATKRAKQEIRRAYLAGADRAVAALDGLVGPAEAVQLFLEKLDVTADWGERIFREALLPPGAAAASSSAR